MFVSATIGFMRGFIKDFFGTCAWFGSGFIAIFVAPYLIPAIKEQISSPTAANCMAILIAYLITLTILLLLIGSISNNVKGSVLSGVDKAVGVLFGLFRGIGLLICFCMLLLAINLSKSDYPLINESKLSDILFPIAESLMPKIYKINVSKPKKKQKREMKQTKQISAIQISKPKIKKEKPLEKKKIEKSVILEKVKDWIIDVFAKRQANIEEDVQNQTPQVSQTPSSQENLRPANKPSYGTGISLLEARKKRRALRKAELLKKELRKRLDSSDI
jgi:uncharacterized membrane protein required for colicin V production